MPIQSLAREDVVHAPPETPLSNLAERMRDERVGSIVITNEQSPVGIVTDRDLTTRVLANGEPSDGLRAQDVMTSEVIVASSDHGVYECAQMMSEQGIRRLPICDENDELCGIITADDLLELFSDEQQQLAQIIQAQRPPY